MIKENSLKSGFHFFQSFKARFWLVTTVFFFASSLLVKALTPEDPIPEEPVMGQGGPVIKQYPVSGGGSAVFVYDMYKNRDRMQAQIDGNEVMDTGLVKGKGTYDINIPAGDIHTLTVIVNPGGGKAGDGWQYAIHMNSGGGGGEEGGDIDPTPAVLDNALDRPDSLYADPIDTATGTHIIHHNLMTLWGAQPLSFTIDYHSLLPFSGSLGRGWSHNYETRLEKLDEGRIRIQWNQKRQSNFTLDNGKKKRKRKNATAGYQAEEVAGRFYQLQPNADNTYTLIDRRNKTQWRFNATGQLSSIQNAAGQSLTLSYNAGNQLISIQEPISGRQLTLTYDQNKISQVSDPGTGRSVTFTYDAENLTGIQLANGNQLSYTYNALGQILSGRDSQGAIFLNTYDEEGRVISQDDGRPETPLTRFSYLKKQPKRKKLKALLSTYGVEQQKEIKTLSVEEKDDLTRGKKKNKKSQKNRKAVTTLVIDRNQQIHFFHHDKKLQLRRRTDFEGKEKQRTHYRYDKAGNLRSVKYPGHRRMRYHYDNNNQMTGLQPAGFAALKMEYDDKNNLTTVGAEKDKKDEKPHQFNYDNNNRLTRYTNPLNQSYQLAYTADGLLQQITKPGGGTSTYTYQQGKPSQIKDPAGNLWSLYYDGAGRLTTLTDAANNNIDYTYDENDRITGVTDPIGNKTLYLYDLRGNLIQITDAENAITTFTYTPHNKLASITDAQNQTTTFTYDPEDRLITVKNTLGNTTTYQYDNAGKRIATIDPLGNRYTHRYDKTGNLVETIDPTENSQYRLKYNSQNRLSKIQTDLGQKQKNHYDKQGRLTRQSGGKGRTKKHDYDAINRLTQTKTSAKQITQQTFDPDGNVSQLSDPNENKTTLEHDKAGRLTSLKTPSGQTTAYTYNSRNLIETVTSPANQKATLAYDPVGRLETLTEEEGQTDYTYDNVGRLLTVTQAGKTITRQYDTMGRLTQFTDTEGNTLKYAYDAIGRLTELTYPDSKKVTYTYDANSRLTTVTDWAGRKTQYTYDKAGRLLETQRPNGTKQTLVYGNEKRKKNDKAGLLTQLTDTAGGKVLIDYHYDYNRSGQLSRQQGEPEFDAPQILKPVDMSYDADNRLIKYNGQSLDYDPNGNLLNSPFGNYGYDSRNRLTEAGTLSYTYDPENRRIAIESPEGTTQFVHNPNALLSQLLVRKTPDGKTTYYIYGLGLLYQENDSQAKYYHYDQQGNTLLLTDQTGQVTDQFTYSPYGELIKREGTTDTPFRYNGRYGVMTDSNGLLQMRARYYSPDLKRFLNQDVLLGNIAEPITLNRFAYANGDPINNIDPFGLAALDSTEGFFQGAMNLYNTYAPYIVPGQTAWNNAINAYNQGNYLDASVFTSQMFGEQILTALTFGSSSSATPLLNQGTKQAQIVLGKFPDYLKLADELGAQRFNIPTSVWNNMSKAEQWAANQKFLDQAISHGNNIILSNPVKNIGDVSGAFRQELDYLIKQGFKLSEDGTKMIR